MLLDFLGTILICYILWLVLEEAKRQKCKDDDDFGGLGGV